MTLSRLLSFVFAGIDRWLGPAARLLVCERSFFALPGAIAPERADHFATLRETP